MPTMQQIVDDTRRFVEGREALYKRSAEEALTNPGGVPGATNDKKVDESAKASDPETKQEIPPGGKSSDGATEGEKVESGHATTATEPEPGVDKKPKDSADALTAGSGSGKVGDQAKTSAAKMANDLLSLIRSAQGAPAKTAAAPAKPAAAPAKATTEPAKTAVPVKAAGGEGIELTQEILAKIASLVLSQEEGFEVVEKALAKSAGAEAARETIAFLQKQAEDQEKMAQYEAGGNDAEALIQRAIWESGYKTAMDQSGQQPAPTEAEMADFAKGAADAEAMIAAAQAPRPATRTPAIAKQAARATTGLSAAQLRQLGREVAEQSIKAAQMEGADIGDDTGGDDVGAEEGAEALGEMGAAPEDEEISSEELQMALGKLVEEGELAPEAAAAIVEHVEGASAVSDAAGAEEPGMEAAASAGGNELLAAIRRIQGQRGAA